MNKAVIALLLGLMLLYFVYQEQNFVDLKHFKLAAEYKLVDADKLEVTLRWSDIQPRPYRIGIDAGGYKDLRNIVKEPVDKNEITLYFTKQSAPLSPLLAFKVYAVDNFDRVYALEKETIPNPFYKAPKHVPEFEMDPPHKDCSSNVVIHPVEQTSRM